MTDWKQVQEEAFERMDAKKLTQTLDDQAAQWKYEYENAADVIVEALRSVLVNRHIISATERRIIARCALQALRANPDILRSMGIGRLPSGKELNDLLTDCGITVNRIEFVVRAIAAGYAVETTAPAEPLPPEIPGDLLSRLQDLFGGIETGDTSYHDLSNLIGETYRRGLAAAEAGRKSVNDMGDADSPFQLQREWDSATR